MGEKNDNLASGLDNKPTGVAVSSFPATQNPQPTTFCIPRATSCTPYAWLAG
jgi:hypothetical protein